MPGLLILFIALSASSAGFLCPAQQAQPSAPIRYHLGDDLDGKLGWAEPNFDDSTWPIAENGHWPMPPFYSDGIVEARNPAGELFGFDRTRAISSQSASQIAKAAELFGQDDDITVLTLQAESV